MPGLSQLKQFNKDLLSLGNEITIRASRGEKPVQVVIPKEVEDRNDSEDFVLGMPEIEAELEVTPVEEDLSDLAGLVSPSQTAAGTAETTPSFEAPDLSSLLNPINIPDDAAAGTDMPDLSMFEEPEEEEEEIVEEEPEEISIADMGLDALLSGGGFDAPEEEPQEEPEPETVSIDDFTEVEDIDSLDEIGDAETLDVPEETQPVDDGLSELERDLLAMGGDLQPAAGKKDTDPSLDDLLGNIGLDEPGSDTGTFTDTKEDGDADLDQIFGDDQVEEIEEPVVEDISDDLETVEEPEAVEEFSTEGLDDFDIPETVDSGEGSDDLDAPVPPMEDLTGGLDDIDAPAAEDFSVEGLGDFDLPADEVEDISDAPLIDDLASGLSDLDETAPVEEFSTEGLDDFDIPETEGSGADLDDLDAPVPPMEDLTGGLDDIDAPAAEDFSVEVPGDFDLPAEETEGLAEVPSMDDLTGGLSDFDETAPADDFSTDGLDDFGVPETDGSGADDFDVSGSDFGTGGLDDFDIPDTGAPSDDSAGGESFSLDDMDFGGDSVPVDFNDEEIPDYGDEFSETEDKPEGEESVEVFDTTGMDGIDFGIPDTDAQLDGSAGGSDFELGGADDFAMEGEFEIPGFSDVQTAKEDKSSSAIQAGKGKSKRGRGISLPEPDFSEAEESEDLPPNTLSDAQYKQFLKNLGEYPLNVRLAFEDLIVQDEFTDDAEFEVIEKILNKAPARQVASMLEKMLDTSIPVPRDFEHRSAEEYEAYKKSLAYQLKNKIIPGILVGIVALLVIWGLFNFSKNCIYRPLKANSLYKQGYALLEADEYPQSEMKFEEAVTYRINKKWFFNYARGYRAHRQYQRAGSMYDRILKYYKHDKAAGLEYADMELNDLANYNRAEEIVRREVLDYHINDADGILKLGDIFLEWGTEKDPVMLESAREQYATLIQLYGGKDLYLSRMMRYFIRSDNLRNVIQMKNTFDSKEKALGAEDLTELSGYLLEKYYGPLAPSDEYLRYEIEGLRGLLLRAVKADQNNPIALYNLSKYFIQSGETGGIEQTLQKAIEKFNTIQSMKKRDIYKYIDSYRLLGEHYISTTDFLQAQEQFAEGISLYTTERDNAGFEGTPDVGKLYADMGNIKYTISGDYDDALMNYKYSVELENDTPSIRYRIGYIQYKNKNYIEALGSFMKAGDGNIKQRNLLLAMANTLSLRGDDYAAQGYYNQLIDSLDSEIAKRGVVFPQASVKDYDVVNTYLSAANNYGVTLYKLAKRTGNSGLNAQAIVQFQQSLRAWDSLTRNQETMVRLGGSNLAEQNIQYITHPIPEFEPAIYTDIAKTLLDNEHL